MAKSEGGRGAFAELLTSAMRSKGLDFRTVASLAGVSHTYVWQLAGGGAKSSKTHRNPGREIAIRLAEILDIDIGKALVAAGHSLGAAVEREPSRQGVVRYSVLRPSTQDLFSKGLEETRLGHFRRGAILLKEAVGHDDISFVRAHTGLGVAYLGSRDFEDALVEFSRVIGLFDKKKSGGERPREIDGVALADVHYNRGLANQDLDRHKEAISDFNKAIKLRGAHMDLYFAARSFSDLAVGRYRRVVFAGLEISRLGSPQQQFTTASLDMRLFQAYALARLGQFEGAVALSDSVILLCPEYWYSSFVGATVLSRYAGSLAKRAAGGSGHIGRAYAQQAEQLAHQAMSRCRRALGLNPQCSDSFLREVDDDFLFLADWPEFKELLGTDKDAGKEASAS